MCASALTKDRKPGCGACCQQIWVTTLSACSPGQVHLDTRRVQKASALLLLLDAHLPPLLRGHIADTQVCAQLALQIQGKVLVTTLEIHAWPP